MKHRTRAVAPEVRRQRTPERRLAALCLMAAALAVATAGSVQAMVVLVAPGHAQVGGAAMAGALDPSVDLSRLDASLSNGGVAAAPHAGALDNGGVAVDPHAGAAPDRAAAAERAASGAGASGTVFAAAPGRSVPATHSWALLGGGLLAVCMIARRQQRQRHD